jgi:glycopeptide antibiotics resistance protein
MIQVWRSLGNAIPIYIIITLVSILILFLLSKQKLSFKSFIMSSSLIAVTLGIIVVTLYPTMYSPYIDLEIPRIVNLVPLKGIYDIIFHSVDIAVPIVNIGGNIILFIPFGLLLSFFLKQKSLIKITSLGFLLSLLIEVIQYIYPTGRISDINDLIFNTFGTFIGAWIGNILVRSVTKIVTLQKSKITDN